MTYSSPEWGGLSSAVTDALRKGTQVEYAFTDELLGALRHDEKARELYLRQLEREKNGPEPRCSLCGEQATEQDRQVAFGRVTHAHSRCLDELKRSLDRLPRPVQKARLMRKARQSAPQARPMSKSRLSELGPVDHGLLRKAYQTALGLGYAPDVAQEAIEVLIEARKHLTPEDFIRALQRH